MAIKKDITLDTTGGTAGYHYVQAVTIDRMSKVTTATVVSYVSEDTFKAGKQPISFPMVVATQGLPEAGADAFAYVEAELVKEAPAEADAAQVSMAPYMANRYLLAGGTVVA